MSAPFLRFQKAFVFVCGGAADVAHSRQFADVQLPVLVGGIVAEKFGGMLPDVYKIRLRSCIPKKRCIAFAMHLLCVV